MHTVDCISQRDTRINLILGNTGQFGAEWGQFRMYCGFYIGLELSNNLPLLDVDNHYWELYDLVESQILGLVLALAFEIIDYDIVKRSLIDEFISLNVEYLSEEIGW